MVIGSYLTTNGMRLKTTSFPFVAVAFLCLNLTIARAATPVSSAPQINPNLINNQNQQQKQQIEQQNALPQLPPVVKAPPAGQQAVESPGASFKLLGVTVDKSPFLSKSEVDAVINSYIGKSVNIGTLKHIVNEINDIFTFKKSFTTSAYLPPQKIENGIVHIAILEGRLGKIKVTGANALSDSFILSYVDVKPNEIVDLPKVANDLARFNETGVARIQAVVQPGSAFGLTDIQLSVTEPPRNMLQLFVDNQGVDSVGKNEAGMLYQLYAPFGIDDKLTVYTVKSQGDIAGDVAYNVPVNSSGGRVGLSVSSGSINVVSGPYQPLSITGTSQGVSANFTQPAFVTDEWMFLVNGALSLNESKSSQMDTTVTSNQAKIETIGFKWGYTNQAMSASVSPTYSFVQSHSLISGGNTDFNLIGGTFYVRSQMPRGFVALLSGAWQASSQDLIPGDQLFQVGGPTTVRGYPANAVAGPSGYFGNFELHHAVPLPRDLAIAGANLDGFVYLDQGGVFNPYPPYQDLRSVGAGLSWNINQYFSAEVNAGYPLKKSVFGQSDAAVYLRVIAKVF